MENIRNYVLAHPIIFSAFPARASSPVNGLNALFELLEPAQELDISLPPRSSNRLLALLIVFSTSSMISALTVGSVRSTWRMFPDSESRRPPKTAPALEAAVPLGAILTPLGGNVTDGRAARVVAKEENDVAVGDVDGVPEAPPVEMVVGLGIVLTLEVKEGSGDPDDTDGDPLIDGVDLEITVLFTELLVMACPPELIEEITVPSDPVAVPPPEPVTPKDESEANSKDHVGTESEEDVGILELPEDATSIES